jgi:HPt (histidine-containing phosphotransfer) domain-containing protein
MVFGRGNLKTDDPFETAPTYDRGRLDEICNGNEELRKRILSEYLKTSPAQVNRLLDLMDTGDADEAKPLAHSLKGSSRTIGAFAMGDLCEEAEQVVSSTVPTELMGRITSEFERVWRAIEEHVGPS